MTTKSVFKTIHLFLLGIMVLTIPYYIAPSFLLLLSILLFLITLYTSNIKIQSLLKEKTFLFLFLFLIMTYLSALWSPAEHIFEGNFKVNIMGYLNTFFLMPAIYFSNLSKEKIKILFYLTAISPVIYIITYYTNFFGLSHIISIHYDPLNGNKHLYVDLFANLFIAFSGIFLYIKLFSYFFKQEFKKMFFFLILFGIVTVSIVIYEPSSSRLITLSYGLTLIYITLYNISSKAKIFTLLGSLLLMIFLISTSEGFKKGIHEVEDTYTQQKFEGSWGHRLKLAQYGLQMFTEHPFIGRGTTDIIDKMRENKKNNPEDFHDGTVHFHNQHILILVQVGILGYLLFLIFIYYTYKLKTKNLELNLYKNSIIIMYMILMIGEHYLQWTHTVTFFILIIALFILYIKQETLETSQ